MMEINNNSKLTFGEELLGVKLTELPNDNIGRVNTLFVEVANIIEDSFYSSGEKNSEIRNILFDHTVSEILNAQMNAVKLIVTSPS